MGSAKARGNTSNGRRRETAAFDWSQFCQSIEVDDTGCITTTELARARGITHRAAMTIISDLAHKGLVEYRGKVSRPTICGGHQMVPVYGPKR